jgi:hypothetical protein
MLAEMPPLPILMNLRFELQWGRERMLAEMALC